MSVSKLNWVNKQVLINKYVNIKDKKKQNTIYDFLCIIKCEIHF